MKVKDLIGIIEPEAFVSYAYFEPMKFEETPIKFLEKDISNIGVGYVREKNETKGAIIIDFSNFTY